MVVSIIVSILKHLSFSCIYGKTTKNHQQVFLFEKILEGNLQVSKWKSVTFQIHLHSWYSQIFLKLPNFKGVHWEKGKLRIYDSKTHILNIKEMISFDRGIDLQWCFYLISNVFPKIMLLIVHCNINHEILNQLLFV